MLAPPGSSWGVVVPVKGGAHGKTRFGGDDATRAALARAFAEDTVLALLSGMPPARLHIVTSDHAFVGFVHGIGARVVDDPGTGLNAAVSAGIAAARAEEDLAVAVLLGDHPALTPGEWRQALTACAAYERAMVTDSEGEGTALLTAREGIALRPAFGRGSAARHRAQGHTAVDVDAPGLRRDVDDRATLAEALRLGVGPMTRAALAMPRPERAGWAD